MLAHSILSIMIWLPIVGGILTLLVGSDNAPQRARYFALATVLISLALCIPLYLNFDLTTAVMQFEENILWIHAYKIHYHLGG